MFNQTKAASVASVSRLLLLLALAGIGNALNVSLFFGVDLIFGSIFVLLILRWHGLKWGVTASILAGGVTVFLWNHPYGMAALVLETVFIGAFYRRRIGDSIILAALYWLLVGAPLIWLGYRLALHMNTTATLTVILDDAPTRTCNPSAPTPI